MGARYATIREAAAKAGISRSTVHRWLRVGKLRYRKRVVTVRMVRISEVRELAQSIVAGRKPKGGR